MTQIPLTPLSLAPKTRRETPHALLQHDALRCFACGGGASAGTLVGSGNASDWVHPGCLATPVDWGAEPSPS